MSRDPVSTLASTVSNTRAVLLTAGIVLNLSSAAWAQSPPAAHDGPCGVAIVHGQHVQPSAECHLPPPLAQNPASIENTPPALLEEIDSLAEYLLGETGRLINHSATPSAGGRKSAQPLTRPTSSTSPPDRCERGSPFVEWASWPQSNGVSETGRLLIDHLATPSAGGRKSVRPLTQPPSSTSRPDQCQRGSPFVEWASWLPSNGVGAGRGFEGASDPGGIRGGLVVAAAVAHGR